MQKLATIIKPVLVRRCEKIGGVREQSQMFICTKAMTGAKNKQYLCLNKYSLHDIEDMYENGFTVLHV